MFAWLWLLPALPFLGFLILGLLGRRLPRTASAIVGTGSVGLAAIIAFGIFASFLHAPPTDGAYVQTLYSWIGAGNLHADFALYLDPLSLVMALVVTGVGFLIHLYATEYMWDDDAFSRFFAYMNLFVASMLVLVLADNLVLLYLGWEGVGLCSYLLIGFWYRDAANGAAARKAFVVTRVGDTALAIGLFFLYARLGTLNIQDILDAAGSQWAAGAGAATIAALLLLGGAVGKSAQLPLQTWLPDAMAGPTPVSALIHAATMVTAGVYLIARMHVVFSLSPVAMTLVAIVGAVTLLLAGFSALTQTDIKRVLAYSTMSQIGYMFLALGVGAWSAAMLHFMVHAFFKSLLFLGAGAVTLSQHHKRDIFEMGGLRKHLPITFWSFLAASAALAGVPVISAGFYSKDLILYRAWMDPNGGFWLWAAGVLGVFLTALYTFRLVFLVFFGESKTPIDHRPGNVIRIPLVILGVLSVVGGFVEIPSTMGGFHVFSRFLQGTFGAGSEPQHAVVTELVLQLISSAVVFAGIYLAYRWYLLRSFEDIKAQDLPLAPRRLQAFWLRGCGFDAAYNFCFVQPYARLAWLNQGDVFDKLNGFITWLTRLGYRLTTATQTGRLRWYASTIAIGAIVVVALMLFL